MRFTPRSPDSPPVNEVQRKATVKPSAVNASVSSEKYTPRRRRTRNPTATPSSAVSATAATSGARRLVLKR